jgi:hypothetical protein
MKLSNLVAAFLLALMAITFASAGNLPQLAAPAVAPDLSNRLAGGVRQFSMSNQQTTQSPGPQSRFRFRPRPTVRPSEVCYAIRSYIFAREDGSDSTRLVGQTTCTPSSKFQMKQSAEPVLVTPR